MKELILMWVIVAMFLTHELSHWITLKLLKAKGIKQTWNGYEYDANSLSNLNKKRVLAAGVIGGIIPIFFFGLSWYYLLAMLALYSCFVVSDIKRYKEL